MLRGRPPAMHACNGMTGEQPALGLAADAVGIGRS
jgi:hypothetical protein